MFQGVYLENVGKIVAVVTNWMNFFYTILHKSNGGNLPLGSCHSNPPPPKKKVSIKIFKELVVKQNYQQ